MGPIQNMEAMFQTWKNIVLRKDLHLGPTIIDSNGDGQGNNRVDTNDGQVFFARINPQVLQPPLDKKIATHPTQQVATTHPTHEHKNL